MEQLHLLQLGDDELAVHVIHLQLQLSDLRFVLLKKGNKDWLNSN